MSCLPNHKWYLSKICSVCHSTGGIWTGHVLFAIPPVTSGQDMFCLPYHQWYIIRTCSVCHITSDIWSGHGLFIIPPVLSNQDFVLFAFLLVVSAQNTNWLQYGYVCLAIPLAISVQDTYCLSVISDNDMYSLYNHTSFDQDMYCLHPHQWYLTRMIFYLPFLQWYLISILRVY